MAAGIEIVGYRDQGVIIPWGAAAERDFETVPNKKLLLLNLHQRRNPEHHEKYWAILQRVCDFCDEFDTAEDVADWVKLKLRMVKSFKDWDGRIVFRTKSTSYASMDQVQFANFYDRAMFIIAQRVGFDPEELLPPRPKPPKLKDAA